MSDTIDIQVPDIGDFSDVPVIEVLVAPGEKVQQEQSLVTLESDKATMEVPSPVDGEVTEVLVEVGASVSEGDVIARILASAEGEVKAETEAEPKAESEAEEKVEQKATKASAVPVDSTSDFDYEVVVIGSGPGGYTAAFRAADLGLKTALIERFPDLGGVCLNVGCIPSKTLLHAADIITEASAMSQHGIEFGEPKIDLDKLRGFKSGVVSKLTGGLAGMAKQRKVDVIQGTAVFADSHHLDIESEDGQQKISFGNAIIAVGSQSMELPNMPWGDPRLMDSTDALELEEIPGSLLIVGGGIIGLEMACVFDALGSAVTVVELTPGLMPGADPDLVRPLARRVKARYEAIHLETRVTQVDVADEGLVAHFEGKFTATETYDRILVAVGRTPNGGKVNAEAAGVEVSDRGFISTNAQMRTNVPHIFAIGDVVGQPMLAHKATHEAKVAAEVCAGHKSAFEARVIPSVAYTNPEIAWLGVTEAEAKEQGLDIDVGKFPWAASGRALGIDRTEGFTKLLFDRKTKRIVGAGIAGPHAGDLISECALAIEMGAEAEDIGLTIHPHPTLSETVAMAAEAFEGTITDLYMPKKK